MTCGCNYRLAEDRKAIGKALRGIREAYRAMRTLGYPVEPPKLRLLTIIPDFILVRLFQRVLRSEIADIGIARHARDARDEMTQLVKNSKPW